MYSDKKKLKDLILENKIKFPFVCSFCLDNEPDQEKPQTSDIYIEGKKTVHYVQFKVVDPYDEDLSTLESYDEAASERGMFAGEELLLPQEYPGKIRHVQKPGRMSRYVSIAQILEDMPRVLRVDDDVVAIPQSGGSKLSIVPANTILRMKRKTVCPKNNCVYVKFTDGDNVYTFKEDARVNFTAITDPKLYNLTDYVVLRDRSSMVEFETAPDKEVVHFGISESSKAAVISGGPIEVIGSVTRDVIVGWARDRQMRSYKTVLIPDTAWNLVSIQERVFSDDFEQEIYIKKKFEHIPDSNFITNSLYIMNIQQNEPVWLISPKLFKFQPTSCSLKAPIPIPFKGSSSEDEDSTDSYEDIKPIVPERRPIVQKNIYVNEVEKQQSEPIKQKPKKTQGIRSWFRSKTSFNPPPRPPKPSERSKSFKKVDRPLPPPPKYERTLSLPANRRHAAFYSDLSESYPSASEYSNTYASIDEFGQKGRAFSQVVTVQTKGLIDGVTASYSKLNIADTRHLLRQNQTCEDFYKLTVIQVYHLFLCCSLPSVAETCLRNHLDGRFFQNFDLAEMQEEPFNISRFQMLKMKQIVFHGWRPSGIDLKE